MNGVARINIFQPNSPRRVFQQLDGSAPTNQIDRTLRQLPDSRTDGQWTVSLTESSGIPNSRSCACGSSSRLEHEVALVFTARRLGDGEDFVSHGTRILMANGQRINDRTEHRIPNPPEFTQFR